MKNIYSFKHIFANKITEKDFFQMNNVEQNSGGEPYSQDSLKQIVSHDGNDNFCCLLNDEIVGIATVNPNSIRLDGSIYIINMSVHKDFQRRGIATQILKTLTSYYAELGLNKKVTLHVDKTNTKAFNLYKKLGFEIVEEGNSDEDDEYLMSRSLTLNNTNSNEEEK